MALLRPRPSPESLQAFKMGLRETTDREGSEDWSRYQHSKEQPQFHIYILGLAEIVRRRAPLDAARPRGWRFLCQHPSKSPIICEVARAGKDAKPSMTGYWDIDKRAVKKYLAALKRYERSTSKDANFELRVLTIPGLQIEAFWLKSRNKRHADKLLPFLSLHEEIKPTKEYRPEDFFGAAKVLAEKRLTFRGI